MAPVRQGLQAQALKSLGPRRFGRVNAIGLATLYRRELWRLQKDYIDGLLGPALVNLLLMLILKLAAGGQNARAGGLPLADFVAPGLITLGLIRFFHACIPAPNVPLLWQPLQLGHGIEEYFTSPNELEKCPWYAQ